MNDKNTTTNISCNLEDQNTVLFRDDVMYQWKKTSEKPHHQTCSNGTPGKIEFKKLPIENGDLSEQRHGAKYTEAEVQQLLMGLKREHKDNLELLQKDHDEALFKLRGQQATSVEYYVEKIQALEEEIQSLKSHKKKAFVEAFPISDESPENSDKKQPVTDLIEEGKVQKNGQERSVFANWRRRYR